MKKVILIFLVIFTVPFIVFAQQEAYKGVVELKNGSIIKGTIIEQIPNQQIKIQTADGNVFVYQMDEVSKLKKEAITKVQNKDKGYLGFSLGVSNPVGKGTTDAPNGLMLSLVDLGYLFTPNVGISGKLFTSSYKKRGVILSITGLMAGGLIRSSISRRVEFMSKVLVGFEKGWVGYRWKEKTELDLEFTYDLGVGIKINIRKNVALLTNFDYIGIKDFGNMNITFGVAYRL